MPALSRIGPQSSPANLGRVCQRGQLRIDGDALFEGTAPMEHTPAMPSKPLLRWSILVLRAKAVWLGDVEATSEAEAIAKGAEEFKQPKERLMAVKRA
jgi:hypothetical protein